MKLPEYPKLERVFEDKELLNKTVFNGDFAATNDGTDHTYYTCLKCDSIAQVASVALTDYNGYPEIYFILSCSKCRTQGLRKLWVGQGRTA